MLVSYLTSWYNLWLVCSLSSKCSNGGYDGMVQETAECNLPHLHPFVFIEASFNLAWLSACKMPRAHYWLQTIRADSRGMLPVCGNKMLVCAAARADCCLQLAN